ncbi:L7Ae/L30e/S12e/Gadd45 family ribosomal protein [Candidatus Contubernalis alkaliaceticus]|uniref:L7Ae/L30e/S12e/Gadd45 family ribosomal protein n=1 Tax=Candidatus Contubernalis alkaliaceticus TaxID=338645 RepID=UPI001F4C49C9|nr:ribosomal L7Ae/L30e/S12e/Gadd45 family protein [Candidatus Contubernalis alkalaceticus]UNC90931.1 ribosomal L7Ae/L30e/S12e/Gadd45 family protein [Candidatus Contubernalis alkalaceticus]
MTLERLQGAVKTVIGTKQTMKAVKNHEAKLVFVALDAENRVTRPVQDLCNEHNIEIVEIPLMDELGKACGIKVGAAMVAILRD